MFGLHQYHPIYHIVSIDSPTGSITHTPDTSFEVRAHGTKLAIGYHIAPRMGLEFGGIIKPLLFGGLQGRGFTAFTIGGIYAI
ncbi:MAG: hypothetical protein AB8G05_18195 [Oligoflexales bacterium]